MCPDDSTVSSCTETAGGWGRRGGESFLYQPLKRTNSKLDSNSHHTTHMKEELKREMAITLMSRGSAQNSFSFSLPRFPPGITQLNFGMLVLGYSPPPSSRSTDLAKINPTYKSSTCPVLLFSGNAWGEYRSVSINLSSQTQINEWSRSERGIMALFRYPPRIYSSPQPSHISFILYLANACYSSLKCKKDTICFYRGNALFAFIHAGGFAY